jgi:hypothetical protein
MFIAALKLLFETSLDAVNIDPRQAAERAQAEAAIRESADEEDEAETMRRFDAGVACRAMNL